MKIIKGNEKHIDACLTIARGLIGRYFTEKAITAIGNDLRTHQLWIAADASNILGFITVKQKNPRVSELSWIAVKLECHHQGIGTALLDCVVDDSVSQGIKLLEVKTLSADVNYSPYDATRQFYEKMGFLHLETINSYPGWDPGSPCAIYIKVLP